MFCPNCGEEIKEGNKLCTNCGKEIKANRSTSYKISKEEKILIVVISIILIGFAFFLLITQ